MAKPAWAKEDVDKDSYTSYLKLGLELNAAKAILSLETEATFGVSVNCYQLQAVTSKQNHHLL